MRRFPIIPCTLLALLLPAASTFAQAPGAPTAVEPAPDLIQPAAVTLEQIMADPDWIGNPPENPYWADDGTSFYYVHKRTGEEHRDLVEMDLLGRQLRVVSDAERGTVDQPFGAYDRDRRLKVYSKDGDLFVKELAGGAIRQLTRTTAVERMPYFLADGRRIVFRRGDSIVVRELDTGLELEPAELRLEKDPDAEDEDPSYLERQQERLIAFIQREKREREAAEERSEAARRDDPTRVPPPFYLGDGVEIRQASLSPAGGHLLVVLGEEDEDQGRRDAMPDYVTESGYVETREVRSLVGTGTPASERLVLLDLASGEQHELDLTALPGIADDPLAELRAAAEARREGENEAAQGIEEEEMELAEDEPPPEAQDEEAAIIPQAGEIEVEEAEMPETPETPPVEDAAEEPAQNGGDDEAGEDEEPQPRTVYFGPAVWSDDGEKVALMVFSHDNKDRWIVGVDLAATALVPLHRLSDPAWTNYRFNEMGWMPDGERLFYLSEESGSSHLYTVAADGTGRRQLTAGAFVVENARPTRDGAYLYYEANAVAPSVWETYRVEVASGASEQMTDLGGMAVSVLSPDERYLLITHSTATRPPELFLQPAVPGAEAERLTHTVSAAYQAIDWVEPEIVEVPSSHAGRPIVSRLFRPAAGAGSDAPAGGPAVLFIHGAGYLQDAHLGWSYYFREHMFHTLLAGRGYTVLAMDYRGSAGYGRDWRTAIYRQMGTPELEDLEDGVAYLAAEHGVDRRRVGVYGGSYGGFLTLMALFKEPDLFACGAALRLVSDWAHYNHGYTSNILNTPELDPEAYERSSPIEFAEGLESPLLMAAPMQDDNVFFKDTVRLVQRLIELEKENWEVALYPVEPHGFRQPSSWLDEYRRIFRLFEENLR